MTRDHVIVYDSYRLHNNLYGLKFLENIKVFEELYGVRPNRLFCNSGDLGKLMGAIENEYGDELICCIDVVFKDLGIDAILDHSSARSFLSNGGCKQWVDFSTVKNTTELGWPVCHTPRQSSHWLSYKNPAQVIPIGTLVEYHQGYAIVVGFNPIQYYWVYSYKESCCFFASLDQLRVCSIQPDTTLKAGDYAVWKSEHHADFVRVVGQFLFNDEPLTFYVPRINETRHFGTSENLTRLPFPMELSYLLQDDVLAPNWVFQGTGYERLMGYQSREAGAKKAGVCFYGHY